MNENYYGRRFVAHQLSLEEKALAQQMPAMKRHAAGFVCLRCQTLAQKETVLETGAVYCRECIAFGRVDSSATLCYFPQKAFPKGEVLIWKGELTPYQKAVSEGIRSAIARRVNSLVHAVTGAGKTEMIYQPVADVLLEGKAVALVSPRIDVCLELYRRFSKDFACDSCLLHGGSEPYQRAPLVIATVHQLFRFYQAFDVIIIDEVDAFPYVDNAALYQAVAGALKPDGVKVFLTATSTDLLDQQVRRGELELLQLSRRFHGNALVVPRPVWLNQLEKSLAKGKLPRPLFERLVKQRHSGFPLLIFAPTIALGRLCYEVLARAFPKEKIGCVSSQTENRLDQVEAFRRGELGILVTTTILERGVTFPGVDVFVLWSHHDLFSKSSLVQISGRVGRSQSRPTGELLFFHDGLTKAMTRAISEIKHMNRQGGFE